MRDRYECDHLTPIHTSSREVSMRPSASATKEGCVVYAWGLHISRHESRRNCLARRDASVDFPVHGRTEGFPSHAQLQRVDSVTNESDRSRFHRSERIEYVRCGRMRQSGGWKALTDRAGSCETRSARNTVKDPSCMATRRQIARESRLKRSKAQTVN